MTNRVLRLVVPAMLPVLLSGCGLIAGVTSSGGSGGSAAAPSGTGGPSWLVSSRGTAPPSPAPSGSPRPTAPTGFLPLSGGGDGRPAATPSPKCSPNTFNFSRIDGLDVAPAATTAVLSWYNVGGFNLREFRLYAISQDLQIGKQRDVGFVTVKPSVACGEMSATIGNLSPKTHYVFSVDAVVTRHSGDGTFAATVARSHSLPTL